MMTATTTELTDEDDELLVLIQDINTGRVELILAQRLVNVKDSTEHRAFVDDAVAHLDGLLDLYFGMTR